MRPDALSFAAAAASLISPTMAFWRLPCQGRLGVARMDPIVNPGEASPHIHSIHGAKNFGMEVAAAELLDSECTSCAVKQDMSNYWTPPIYFVKPDGSAEMVKQVGGTLVYYFLRGENIKAFPKDFKMVAGDTNQRNLTFDENNPPRLLSADKADQFALMQQAIGFNCMNYAAPPEDSLHRHSMPDKAFMDANCKDGMRLEMYFPSCWNGKDPDSEDHRSHILYPQNVQDGACPPGFETRTPSLFFETIWDTAAFAGQEGEFVLSNGDPTGYGYHADFMNGWEDGILQKAVDQCTDPSGEIKKCKVFDLQEKPEMQKCTMDLPEILANERWESTDKGLPGDVPINRGPAYVIGGHKGSKQPSSAPPPPPPAPTSKKPEPPPSPPVQKAQFYEEESEPASSTSIQQDMVAPAPTPEPADPGATPYTTSTYTEGNTVYEVVIYQEEVTQGPGQQKRHAHGHAHGHAHHQH